MVAKHYLITRFNIPIGSMLTKQLNAIDVATDVEYLTERFRLFETYTVPSVKQQTNNNFVWLVLFSDKIPEQFKRKIEEIRRGIPNFVPLYISEDKDMSAKLESIIHTPGAAYITSRMDNDDALAHNFVEEVQRRCALGEQSEKYAVIFNDGCQFDDRSRYCNKYHFEVNHFSSLFVPSSETKYDCILHYSHMEIEDHVKVVAINTDEPMWLEVIHGTNVSNRIHVSKNDMVFANDYLRIFGVANVKVNDVVSPVYVLLSKPRNVIRLFKQYGLSGIIKKAKEKLIK